MKVFLIATLLAAVFVAGVKAQSAEAQSPLNEGYEPYREMALNCAGSTNLGEDVLECIGRATDACVAGAADDEDASYLSDRYRSCLRTEHEAWEWMMETEFEPAFRNVGVWFSASEFGDGYLQNKFRIEQEYWRKFRDISCELAGDLRAPPPDRRGVESYLMCMRRMNAERYVDLMNLANSQ